MSLKKCFIIFLFLHSFCYGVSNYEIINKVYVKKENTYKKLSINNFKDIKQDLHEIKVVLNKKYLLKKTTYLQIICDVDNLIYSSNPYEKEKKSIFVKIDKNNFDNLYLTFKYETPRDLNFSIINMNKFEYENLHEYKQLILGLSLGIVFCAFLYNLIIYFNTFNNAFLYYSIMQFFLFIILFYRQSYVEKTFISALDEITLDISATIAIISLLAFSKEVLYLKEKNKKINFIFNFLIIINLIDIFLTLILKDTILYQLFNRSFIIAIILLASIYLNLKKQKETILYALGWFVIFVTLFLMEFSLVNISGNLLYLIGLPLESLILSFALGYRLKKIIKDKESLLIQQNKLASMGEMLNNIAHQWRQPLTNLSFINMDLQLAIKRNEIKEQYLNQIVKDSNEQIDFMSKTLDNFKGFYLPNKQKIYFKTSTVIKKAISIIKPSLKSEQILLDLNIVNDSKLNSYENEFIQVILNILNNAKDAFIDKKIIKPHIKITIDTDEKQKVLITIEDNAGGIKEDIIQKIYDPYFSTKYKNSGIGLYMSKIIVDSHLKGQIEVKNKKMGACFKILI